MLFSTEGQQQQQRVATNVLADDKKVQAKVAKKLAKQQVLVYWPVMYSLFTSVFTTLK